MDSYFTQNPDATGLLGLPHVQKVNEYVRISATVASESLKRFCSAVVAYFGVPAATNGRGVTKDSFAGTSLRAG